KSQAFGITGTWSDLFGKDEPSTKASSGLKNAISTPIQGSFHKKDFEMIHAADGNHVLRNDVVDCQFKVPVFNAQGLQQLTENYVKLRDSVIKNTSNPDKCDMRDYSIVSSDSDDLSDMPDLIDYEQDQSTQKD